MLFLVTIVYAKFMAKDTLLYDILDWFIFLTVIRNNNMVGQLEYFLLHSFYIYSTYDLLKKLDNKI